MLAVDAVAAAVRHQGMPMGMAEIAVALWSASAAQPANPALAESRPLCGLQRSRFDAAVFAAASDRLTCRWTTSAQFRQLHSKTPGHPEYGITAGIETTTRPARQGIANAVGMALAEKLLNKRFGDVIDHRTYVFLGDGCMMEGVSHESLFARRCGGLNKLVAFYDDNGISIDGDVRGWFPTTRPSASGLRLARDPARLTDTAFRR